jgi:hypothetical protein
MEIQITDKNLIIGFYVVSDHMALAIAEVLDAYVEKQLWGKWVKP